jgi:hypothetical protein
MHLAGVAGVQPGCRWRVAWRLLIVWPVYLPPATSITSPGRAREYATFQSEHGAEREQAVPLPPGLTKIDGERSGAPFATLDPGMSETKRATARAVSSAGAVCRRVKGNSTEETRSGGR